jgi:hypothetical protein
MRVHILYRVHQLSQGLYICMDSWILNFQQFRFSLMIKLFPLTWLIFQEYFVHRTLSFFVYLLSQFLQGSFIHMTQRKYVTITGIWWPIHILSGERLYRSWYRKIYITDFHGRIMYRWQHSCFKSYCKFYEEKYTYNTFQIHRGPRNDKIIIHVHIPIKPSEVSRIFTRFTFT